jgi:TonB family protein
VVKKGLPDIKPKIYTGSGRGFTYSYYLNILLNKIGKNWHNPFKGKDIILRNIVYFEVDKNGNIYSVRLEEDSGNDIYNETAMRAVIITKSLPPLPEEFADDYLKVHLEFLTAQ